MNILHSARQLKHQVWRIRKRISAPGRYRAHLARSGVSLTATTAIAPGASIMPGSILGRETWVGKNGYIGEGCIIGDGVTIADDVHLLTTSHKIGPPSRRAGEGYDLPIRIGDGCWIGFGVRILAGVVVEPGCIIGTGAVVVNDCHENGIYAGIPARRIKTI